LTRSEAAALQGKAELNGVGEIAAVVFDVPDPPVDAPGSDSLSRIGHWRSPEGPWVRSCAIMTTEANEPIAPIHDRMPAILGPDAIPIWLGEEKASAEELKSRLVVSP